MSEKPGRVRRRRDERLVHPPFMRLTERDKRIVEAVCLYKVLRQDQIEALFFSHKAAAQRRLVKLYDYGFLERYFLPTRGGLMSSPVLYGLDKRGVELLRAEFGYEDLRWYPTNKAMKDDFLEHTLAIADFRVAVTLACRQLGYELLVWKGEAELKADYDRVNIRVGKAGSRWVSVIPDSYFAIATPHGRTHFFLELDRGTMTTKRFKTKIAAYLAYYATGGYERRFGTKSLRVLTVVLGQTRLANLKRVTEEAKGMQWFYFALLPEITAPQVLSTPIWRMAGRSELSPLVEPVAISTVREH